MREAFHRFPAYLSPLSHQDQESAFLFVQDLFDIARCRAKDPKGLQHLSQVDMLSLGLREPCRSKIQYVEGRVETLRETHLSKFGELPGADYGEWMEMEELCIFHEAFGFTAYSPDIWTCLLLLLNGI